MTVSFTGQLRLKGNPVSKRKERGGVGFCQEKQKQNCDFITSFTISTSISLTKDCHMATPSGEKKLTNT